MNDTQADLIPFYFVADVSYSMKGVTGELESGLVELLDALHTQPMAAAKVRFSVVSFSDDAVCHLDLVDLRSIERMPRLDVRGGTSFAAAFNDLHARIDADVDRLKRAGCVVRRPSVFFLTDGAPTDSPESLWRTPLARLKDPNYKRSPNILAFGIGDADAATILEVASKQEYAWIAAAAGSLSGAVTSFFTALVNSVVSSGNALANGVAELPMVQPAGFVLAMDEV